MDQQEFADRTEAIKTRLYRTAYLYLGSEADALEAVDETVYRALRKLKQLQTPALFETWITRILINACQDELRAAGGGFIPAAWTLCRTPPGRMPMSICL